MFFQHHRFQIWNANQHPYRHNASEFSYSNPSLPPDTVYNLQQAVDWVFAVLYPNTKPSVDNVGDLPMVGNTLNDYRIVLDDGDGKSAAYRWEQREGEVAPSWHKIYDMDWGEDSILSNFLIKTQDMYVFRYGHDDIDPDGNPPPAEDSGQHIYGGASANTHLHLHANAGDGVGPQTGYVVIYDSLKPYQGYLTVDVGEATDRFRSGYFNTSLVVGNLTIATGSITDTSGLINFGATTLYTSTQITAGDLTISSGQIVDFSGTISFGNEHLVTLGSVTANNVQATGAASAFASGTTVGNLTLANGSITDSSGTISFNDENLTTTGNITGNRFITSSGYFQNTDLGTLAGNLTLTPFSGDVVVNNRLATVDRLTAGNGLYVTTFNANILNGAVVVTASFNTTTYSSNRIEATANLIVKAAGNLFIDNDLLPNVHLNKSLGSTVRTWDRLYVSSLSSAGVSITMPTILTFRNSVGTVDGQSLFWDNTLQEWLPSLPDTEIDHGAISGLLDDDHTQYLLLAGRVGGQLINGGTSVANELGLRSNSASPLTGAIVCYSNLRPSTDNQLNIGSIGNRFGDIFMGGQGKGFRAENFATFAGFAAASGSNIGRLAYDVAEKDLYFDIGGAWKRASVDTSIIDDAVLWDGIVLTNTYNVAADCTDARRMVWSFKDVANDYEQMIGASIKHPSATQVTVTFDFPPPAGTYRLVGVGL